MKITVRKCLRTGKIFEKDADYLAHLADLRKVLKVERDIRRGFTEADAAFEWAANNVRTVEEFEDWFRVNWNCFVSRAYMVYRKRWNHHNTLLKKKAAKIHLPKLVRMSMRQLTDDVGILSNTHDCPKNGVKNFRQIPSLPTGYAGWKFRIEFTYTGEFPSFVSDTFEDTIVNFGSGGARQSEKGTYTYHSEVRLYADDWPAMRVHKEKQVIWDQLTR